MENSKLAIFPVFSFPSYKMSIWDSISLPLSWRYTHQNLPYMLVRRYSIWEVVLYRSLPPVFLLFPLSHLIYFDAWRVFCIATEMMSLQFSVSSIQFYDNDLLFTFPTWPFSMNFSQHNSSLFFYHALTTPKVTRRQVLFVPCFISWEKSAASWTHFLSVSIFGHIFYLLLMTIFQVF